MWKRAFGDAECRHTVPVAQTLIGDVVDGEDRRHVPALPAQIGRRQATRPVIHMQHIRLPTHAGAAGGDLGGGERQAREADVIVRPVMAFRPGIRTADTLIQRWRKHQVENQAISGACLADAAGSDAGAARQMCHHRDIARLGNHLGIGRQKHTDIDVATAQRARQSRRHLAQSPGLGKVGELAGREQYFHGTPASLSRISAFDQVNANLMPPAAPKSSCARFIGPS